MVSLRKKIVGSKTYFYLEHSLRSGKTIQKKEQYLGTTIPSNLEQIKVDFIKELNREKWHALLDHIRHAFSHDQKLMPKSIKEKELGSFAIKFTYNTQKIEGSTLTLRETANLLDKGITPKERPLRDVKEAEAHQKVFYEMIQTKKELSAQMVLSWHKLLFDQTRPDIAGKIRTYGVAISGSKFVPPSPVELDLLLREFYSWYHHSKPKMHPVELAALVHLKFVTIHPFGDGNGRISRLLMNFILHRYAYPLLDIAYENRNGYYHSLERSQVTKNEHVFVQWFMKRYIKENKKYSRPSKNATP